MENVKYFLSIVWGQHVGDIYKLYSNVIVLVFRYSFSASLPRSFPKPDCLNPPNGAATSVLLYLKVLVYFEEPLEVLAYNHNFLDITFYIVDP